MGLKNTVGEGGGGQRALPEEGLTKAICYQVLYIGHHDSTYNGKTTQKPKIKFAFELPDQTHVFKEENGEQPFMVSVEHNLYLDEKSNLHKFVKQWDPKMKLEKGTDVDFEKLLGKPAMINVVHNTAKNGNTYANIGSVAPLMKGITVEEPINSLVAYDVDEHEQRMEAFALLPDWLQKKIGESTEMVAKYGDKVDEAMTPDLPIGNPSKQEEPAFAPKDDAEEDAF